MAVPKRKTSRARRDKRRSHDRLKPLNLTECPQCHQTKLPHHACLNCGHYKGRQAVEVE